MSSDTAKDHLESLTGVPAARWKRESKRKGEAGSEVRVFADPKSGRKFESVEAADGSFDVRELGADAAPSAAAHAEPKAAKPAKAPAAEGAPAKLDAAALRAAKKLARKHFEEDAEVEEGKAGFAALPALFKFCFLADSNEDFHEELLAAGAAGDKAVAVNGFVLFVEPVDASLMDGSTHLAGLLGDHLPSFLEEAQEQAFVADPEILSLGLDNREGSLASGAVEPLPYDRVVASMEAAGFLYDRDACALASLGGSGGADPIPEPEPASGAAVRYCVLLVEPKDRDHCEPDETLIAVAIDLGSRAKNPRKELERQVKASLPKYNINPPGRLMNSQLPQLELAQLFRKRDHRLFLGPADAAKIDAELAAKGWTRDPALASPEAAAQWTFEQWALEPFPGQPKRPNDPATRSDIVFKVYGPELGAGPAPGRRAGKP